jgi:hypothetical protein
MEDSEQRKMEDSEQRNETTMDRLGDTKVEAPTVILSMKIGAV